MNFTWNMIYLLKRFIFLLEAQEIQNINGILLLFPYIHLQNHYKIIFYLSLLYI